MLWSFIHSHQSLHCMLCRRQLKRPTRLSPRVALLAHHPLPQQPKHMAASCSVLQVLSLHRRLILLALSTGTLRTSWAAGSGLRPTTVFTTLVINTQGWDR